MPQVSRVAGLHVGLADALDIVDAVAVRADGGELGQPFLEQGLAVDALQVFLVGGLGVDVVLDDDVHVLVAAGAHEGDVLPADDRGRVRHGLDVVLAVAVPAAGDVLVAALDSPGRGRCRRKPPG